MTEFTPARLAELRAVAGALSGSTFAATLDDYSNVGRVAFYPIPDELMGSRKRVAAFFENLPETVLALTAALEAKTAEAAQWEAACTSQDGALTMQINEAVEWGRERERERDEARAEVERLKVVDKLLAEAEEANETYQGIEKELDELKTALAELAPSTAIIPTEEVVVDGDIFTWGDLPGVLSRTRESLVEARQEAKGHYVKRQAAEAALERVKDARANYPECDKYDDNGPVVCGWKRTVQSIDAVLQAIEGAEDV